jgi:hypothetical protein
MEQVVRDLDNARPYDHDQKRRERAQDQREGDLHRHLLRPSLGPLATAHRISTGMKP